MGAVPAGEIYQLADSMVAVPADEIYPCSSELVSRAGACMLPLSNTCPCRQQCLHSTSSHPSFGNMPYMAGLGGRFALVYAAFLGDWQPLVPSYTGRSGSCYSWVGTGAGFCWNPSQCAVVGFAVMLMREEILVSIFTRSILNRRVTS